MSQYFHINPQNPALRLVRQVIDILQAGGLIIYPTDSCYALGCLTGHKQALTRMMQIKDIDKKHDFTMICLDITMVSAYAEVSNMAFKWVKRHTPGPYTFILPATRHLPNRLAHPKRKTIGVRIPSNAICLMLVETLGEPLVTTSLWLPNHPAPYTNPEQCYTDLSNRVDLVIDGGMGPEELTTIVDLTGTQAELLRQGLGAWET